MAKLRKKSNIHRAMGSIYSDAEMVKRNIEHSCFYIMDDMRRVFAYTASCHLANAEYGSKRLQRIEKRFNDYIASWRKDMEAETIVALVMYAKELGYDYHKYGEQIPTSYIWQEFNRHMPAKYNRMCPVSRKTTYVNNMPKMVILFAICALEDIRKKYHDITKADIERCLHYFVVDMQCVADKKSGITIKDIEAYMKEEKRYTFGMVPGSWHEIALAQ